MTTVHITNGNGEQIVGILQEKSREKRLVLIVHGEQGHKNHLYQESLAKQLSYSSFRFDFCGNGDSGGQPGYDHIETLMISIMWLVILSHKDMRSMLSLALAEVLLVD
ncbi:hypothetical protein BCV71DRAFT_9548 [Rhizopus microsporus]|uniref:Serine aminopeptidase S33 domain-containing protein n=1 Tax=Rhizopus microsporus TaxID=58291 RepID=A0A1X0RYA5_RHIZD|nr:hypothetical protein BCV71DRAFT_9548 [Rhizopus microsporus]